ncbi:MAG: tRNA 4-thiouridine(8) synthase ThiI [Peptococcaceae bacterium]|nr:tRNA 4-thiouridine(8) synthase ThiI [Peptococcaceae bacterium]
MYDHIVIRYAEIALKGKNQKDFLNRLVHNIKEQVKTDLDINPVIEREMGRLYLKLEGRAPELFYDSLNHVFGISSYSPARKTGFALEDIKAAALGELRAAISGPSRFRVSVKRANKQFPVTSPEMQQIIAAHMLKNVPGLKADLHHYDIDLLLEIRTDGTYIYTRSYPGLRGLPVGSSGRGVVLLSGGIDSPVAGWLAMKRGVTVEAVHFHSYPYTSEKAKEKVLELAKRMARYSNRVVVHMVPFTKIQEEIAHYCHDNMRIPIMRRIMVRIAEEIARRRDCLAIFTGDNLGQVASQTMESIYAINNVAAMPILRPCITMEKEEIIRLAQQIDTYETSILPYEDCCTVFVPKEPKTRPKVDACEKEEEKLELDKLIADAVANTERIIMYGKDKPERRRSADEVILSETDLSEETEA